MTLELELGAPGRSRGWPAGVRGLAMTLRLRQMAERRVFELLLDRLVALGYVKKRGKQRTDSIAVLGAVRDLSALETVTETLRLAVRAAEAAAPEWAAATLPPDFRERYARTKP